jgi:hypothetical protein
LEGLGTVLERLFLLTVFIEQTDRGWVGFSLFYTGGGVVGEHIVKASFLFISLYQTASAKCSVFLETATGWGANKRNREGIK